MAPSMRLTKCLRSRASHPLRSDDKLQQSSAAAAAADDDAHAPERSSEQRVRPASVMISCLGDVQRTSSGRS